ncbi:Xaa-Pro aminopeptidase (plasmid) [Deinococcus peraridilitoris DSM 19664]|uniref:Xaa-Pro aminopeptidase n=2 Tax=Deinococcus TaxID=1298 RepID=L0A618_DEIPD|nr:Xaa-Pro aminopeptidase [Deinococcus peraridilitoris DSM 19664]
MHEANISAVHLVRPENLAWLTGARTHIALMGERGVLEAIITPDHCTFISNAIEACRLEEEEGVPPIQAYGWWETQERERLVQEALGGQQAILDLPALPAALERLRQHFEPDDDAALLQLGRDAGTAIARAVRELRPELTEFEASAHLAKEVIALGMTPVVNLCAGNERLQSRRHPLPTHARLGSKALLVLCARRNGPIVSVSRMVSFTPPDAQEEQRYRTLLEIEAQGLNAAERGGTLEEVFRALQTAYGTHHMPEEITLHHQGGLAGYRPRESRAEPGNTLTVQDGHLLALNPSISGFKVEDTFLRRDGRLLDLTLHDWPTLHIQGRARPGILHPTMTW